MYLRLPLFALKMYSHHQTVQDNDEDDEVLLHNSSFSILAILPGSRKMHAYEFSIVTPQGRQRVTR